MKYFIINTVIKDGEYEYLSQSPVTAETSEAAIAIQEKDAKEWTEHDYREYEVTVNSEITKEEYEIIKKHIY